MAIQSQTLKNVARTLLRRSPGIESALRGLHIAFQLRPVPPGDLPSVGERLSRSWKDDGIPAQQRALVQPHLDAYREGKPNQVFDALVDTLLHNVPELQSKSLLEIGCSSGHYLEVLRSRRLATSYQGCDFSPAFICLARQMYPSNRFDVEDATSLTYCASSFDIVVSGGCISLILDYERAIAEAIRVSREFVVFHRTPVLHMTGPSYYTKKAYGVKMLEIHFNEQQLVRIFVAQGLQVIDINSHHSLPESRQSDLVVHKTYLCRKVK